MRLMSNPSPLDALLDGMKLHHERARRHLEQVRQSGSNKTAPDKREELELAAAKELKSAADFAKAAIAYTQERGRTIEPSAGELEVEIRDFGKRAQA